MFISLSWGCDVKGNENTVSGGGNQIVSAMIKKAQSNAVAHL